EDPFAVSNITPPTLSYSAEEGYQDDQVSQGVKPNKGTASSTVFAFKAVYESVNNIAPTYINLVIGDGVATSTHQMTQDTNATSTPHLYDGDYSNTEQYFATSTFQKGVYQYHFEASDGTNTVRFPETGELALETGYSNVVFLPGHQASRLYEDRTIIDKKIWEPGFSDDISALHLNTDGTSKNPDIYTKDIVDTADVIGPTNPNIYLGLKVFMNKMVNDRVINEWKATPYDWRLGLEEILASGKDIGGGKISYLQSTSSPYILQEIARLAETSQTGSVTLVTHSNGGLLAKILLNQLENNNDPLLEKIDKLILVAVPQLGTPQAVVELLHGGDPGFFSKRILNKKERREFAENMASAYNLLPSQEYFSIVDTDKQPIVKFSTTTSITADFRTLYGDFIETQIELQKFLLGDDERIKPSPGDINEPNIVNSDLLTKANGIQAILDTWTPPADLDVVQIAGWGIGDTVRGIEYVEITENICNQDNSACLDTPILDPRPITTQDGDGTVVTASAIGLGTSTPVFYVNNFDHNEELGGGRRNRKHAELS
ncbi:hypothetical protein ACFLY0_02500, partial [Patescibacteria group bacterium]